MNLKPALEAHFFPFVIRPARYIGNEWGALRRDSSAAVSVAVAVPDKYDRGMCVSRLHQIYGFLNSLPEVSCERVFAPESDAEQRLLENDFPLFTLESFRPAKECDLLLIVIPRELNLINIPTLLSTAGIPVWAKERDDSAPLVGAYGTRPGNPEPIADLLDFCILGAPFSPLHGVVQQLADLRGADRSRRLKGLAGIPGVYIPSYYTPSYDNSSFGGFERINSDAPEHVSASSRESVSLDFPPILPYEDVVTDRLQVTIARGYDPAQVAELAVRHLSATGYDELSLEGDLESSPDSFDRLVTLLSSRLQSRHPRILLPALAPNAITLQQLKLLSHSHRPTLRLRIGAGSERLRHALGLFYSTDRLFELLANASVAGWKAIRLELFVGFPEENEDDLEAAVDLLHNCARVTEEFGRKINLVASFAPLLPRPFTEWQWDRIIPIDELSAKVDTIQRKIRRSGVQVRSRSAEQSLLSGILARGDRRLARVILKAHQLGARFDSWHEHFSFDVWKRAFEECGDDWRARLDAIPFNQPLPWGHLVYDKSLEELRALRESAISGPQPMPRQSVKLRDIVVARNETAEQILAPAAETRPSYGRRPRRIAPSIKMAVPRSRVRLQWTKDEPVRFVGHLATMRMFERAIRRAGIPVSYSQGFQPRQRLSFGPPLALGYTSSAEYIDLQLEEPFQEEFIRRLNRVLPEGFGVVMGKPVLGKASSISSLINVASYEVYLSPEINLEQQQIDAVLSRSEVMITRKRGEESNQVDVRSSILGACLRTDAYTAQTVLVLELALGSLGFVRPDEVLESCFGLPEALIYQSRIHRTALLIQEGERRLTPFEVG